MKATHIKVKQYLRDQINRNTADPVNEILQNYENLAQENVSNNHDSQGMEDTYMNNNNGTDHSNMQGIQEVGYQPAVSRREIRSRYQHTKI